MSGEELDGATNVGDYAAWPSNAGEFAARWNARDPEDREARARRIIEDAQTAGNCWQADHAGRIEGLTARAERAEQKSAELAAVIAEALASLETTGIHEAYNILSAVPADALSAYTTRIREEAAPVEWEYLLDNGTYRRYADDLETVREWQARGYTARRRTKPSRPGPWSDIPEGQNDNAVRNT